MARSNVANTLVVPTETTVLPYYDDFDESKNFHRLLFRPGYAVQARELTQLQTILQNQIERFGRHIFENGSSVIGGDVIVPENSYATLKLDTEYAGEVIDVNSFLNKIVTLADAANTVLFRVSHVTDETDDDPPALYGTYITPTLFDDATSIKVQGESIYANTITTDHAALSRLAYLRDSIFFYNGFFVKVPAQTTVIGKFTTEANCRIGLELEDDVITENTDSSLLDPAQDAFNYQAPGSARYKIELNLTTRTLDSEDDTKFIELARVEGGKLRKLVQYPLYSEIEEVLARRTYDESGNYTVRPFVLNFAADRFDPDNYYAAKLSPGKAYIYGYEYETISDTELRLPKARTTTNVSAYDLNMNYGNYVICQNVRGTFDSTTFQLFDIHCVDQPNVAIANSTVYAQSKIGTGRIRDLSFFSGDTVVDDRKYEFYLFDTQFSSKNTNVSTANTTHITVYDPTLKFSTANHAYSGATLKVTDISVGTVYTYQVNTYNGITRSFGLAPGSTWGVTWDNTDTLSLEFDFSDAEIFLINSNFTANATANAQAVITTLNKSGGANTGDAFVFEPTLNSLVFPLPENFVANGLSNMAYTYRRKFTSITFTNGVSSSMVAGTTPADQFVGTTASSNIASTVMDNFLVVVTNPLSSTRYTGEVVKVSATVTGPDPETCVLSSANTLETFTATVFAKMEYDTGLQPRTKTLYTKSIDVLSSDTPTMIIGPTGSTANVYLPTGQVTISNPSRRVGVAESLYICDVQSVTIYDLNGASIPAAGNDIYSLANVTNKYELNSGQKDTHYDHAFIKLKPGYTPPIGPLIVCCRYYSHSTIPSGGGGFFIVDSYSNLGTAIHENSVFLGDGYSIIPQYRTSDGTTLELRDCIDFRPTRENGIGLTPNYTLSNGRVPVPTTDFTLDYSYYLGRRDLIVLNANKTMSLVQGTPSKNPFEPTVPSKSMVLYTLIVPPYTEYYSDIGVKYIDNKRYTMRDIGKIDKRVENLEYYVTLNTLEKSALDINITDVDGLNRTKHGIFVDSFNGHSLGDSDLDDYKCAMNFTLGWMQNQAVTTGFPMEANTTLSSGVTFTRDKAVLEYTTTKYLEQPWATKYAPISEYLYAVFEGNIITSPEADIWKSTLVAPDIILTDTNTNEYTTVSVYESVVDSQVRR